jgi:hypothetical protein
MLKYNSMTRREGEDREHAGRFWREAFWALIFSVVLVTLFPSGLAAQDSSPASTSPANTPFGTGISTPLQFAGESEPENLLWLSVGASALYDDNVTSSYANGVGDEAVAFTSRIGLLRKTEHLTVSFDYVPYFLLYRKLDQYDRLNHAANMALSFRLAPRFILGLHDSLGYQDGVNPSLAGQPIPSGLSSPTSLNQGIYTYTTRTLTNMVGMNLTFEKSARTSLTLSGGYNLQKFGNQTGQNGVLYNDTAFSAGLGYQYRVTEHTHVGLSAFHQDSTYQGGQIFGNRLRSQVESVLLSLGSRLSPAVNVTIFGGPQYIQTLGQATGQASAANGLQGAGGGSLVWSVRQTALSFSAQRAISDGGGLYTAVISTNANVEVRRRLVGHWEAGLHGGITELDTSLFKYGDERTRAVTGGLDVSRPLRSGSSVHISYVRVQQVSKGSLPIAASLNRDQVTIGFDYTLKDIPLGR